MKRVNKATARKLYNSGIPICIVPCKCQPSGDFFGLCNVGFLDMDFDSRVRLFTRYNCNAAQGKYPAFYIKGE